MGSLSFGDHVDFIVTAADTAEVVVTFVTVWIVHSHRWVTAGRALPAGCRRVFPLLEFRFTRVPPFHSAILEPDFYLWKMSQFTHQFVAEKLRVGNLPEHQSIPDWQPIYVDPVSWCTFVFGIESPGPSVVVDWKPPGTMNASLIWMNHRMLIDFHLIWCWRVFR